MLLLLPLVMALVALAQAQKTLNWIQKMPTGYSLNQGDSIKLVLDDFIDVKGARFYTGDNKDVPNSDIIPKINLFSKNVQLIDGNAKICYQSYTDNTGSVYMICQGRFLVMVKTDATLGNVTAASSFELVTPQTGDAGLILKKENQICGEISEENGVFYIPCFIQPTDSAPASNIFIFRVPRPASGNFTGTVVNYTICKNEKPANVQNRLNAHSHRNRSVHSSLRLSQDGQAHQLLDLLQQLSFGHSSRQLFVLHDMQLGCPIRWFLYQLLLQLGGQSPRGNLHRFHPFLQNLRH